MKLALDLGTSHCSAAWTTTEKPRLLPLRNESSPFVKSVALWRDGKVAEVGDDAFAEMLHSGNPDDVLLERYRGDFGRTRLRYVDSPTSDSPTGRFDKPGREVVVCPDGYAGPFFRHGLVQAQAGVLKHLWSRLSEIDEERIGKCDGLRISVPLHFHDFSKRRYLAALRQALAGKLFADAEFYRKALQSTAFVSEPLALLAALEHLYNGRARDAFVSARATHCLLIDIGAGYAESAAVQMVPGDGLAAISPSELLGASFETQAAGGAIEDAMLDALIAIEPEIEAIADNPVAAIQLRNAVRQAKHAFGDAETDEAMVIVPDRGTQTFTRDMFAEAIGGPVDALHGCIDHTLERALLSPGEVDVVVLVGGTAVLPEIQTSIEERFGGAQVVAPTLDDLDEAMGAVTLGMARVDRFGHHWGLRPTNRAIKIYNSNWDPSRDEESIEAESLSLVYDPREPEQNRHKEFWWGTLQVPLGFRRLSVTVFESILHDNFLFTLWGIPVEDDEDISDPGRFQVYVDPTNDRVYPRIWVWDVKKRKFLVKAFNVQKQSEEALRDFVENERAYFPFVDGVLFDGRPVEGDLAWMPPVKRLQLGDYVRVLTGDRRSPHWFNVRHAAAGGGITPVQRVTAIYPRGDGGTGVDSLDECLSWCLSDYDIVLDDDPPRNLQGLFVEHAQDATGPKYLVALPDDEDAISSRTLPIPRSAGFNTGFGRPGDGIETPPPPPIHAPTQAFAPADLYDLGDVEPTADPVQDADPAYQEPADDSTGRQIAAALTAAEASYGAEAGFPENWAESSRGSGDGSLLPDWRSSEAVREILARLPAHTPDGRRGVLDRLMTGVLAGEIPPHVARAAAGIIDVLARLDG
jgi:hypothetical protein